MTNRLLLSRARQQALLLLAAAISLGAQDKSAPLSKTERKNLAPISKEVLRVKLPRPVETKLDNGLTLLVLEDHRLPTVTVQLVVRGAGGLADPRDTPGLASAVAQMLREGTTTRSSRQIAEEIEGLGANLFVMAGFSSNEATINASGLSDNFDRWFEILQDVVLNANFSDGELQKYKQRQLAQIKQQRSQAQFLASERFNRAVYGNFPAAVVSATPESIAALSTEGLTQWHREHYAPQNAILAIAGDVKATPLAAQMNRTLAVWKKTDVRASIPPSASPAATKKVYLVDRPGSVQTNLVLGNIAIDRKNPDYFALTVANRVLGGGPSGRLFLNLREEKGYTYGAYSQLNALQFAGPWESSAEVRTAVTEGSMKEFFYEFNRLRDEAVSPSELDDAKRSIVAQFALSLEQPAEVVRYAVTRKLYGLPDDYWDTYPAKITAITSQDVERVAKKYMNLDAIQIVAVGDAKQIAGVLEKYGPVSIFNVDGTPR